MAATVRMGIIGSKPGNVARISSNDRIHKFMNSCLKIAVNIYTNNNNHIVMKVPSWPLSLRFRSSRVYFKSFNLSVLLTIWFNIYRLYYSYYFLSDACLRK